MSSPQKPPDTPLLITVDAYAHSRNTEHAHSTGTLQKTASSEPAEQPNGAARVFRPPDEASPKPLNFSFPAKARVVEDDAASDASSDLFEIESFSTATHSQRSPRVPSQQPRLVSTSSGSTSTTAFFFGRRSVDEGSTTPTITECYEPSEASIEWSVTTAEGHDEAVPGVEEKWKRKGGNGLLVSCRCEKAVSVGPQPVKCGSEGQRGATSPSASHVNAIASGGTVVRLGV
ncbi:protein PHYTOCHROME KINASE SUBSTRATE 4-like [Vigna umbellata]|uniref:protein PHYTOCHROME KINASE SUBSTRATE 4-like n=1 Tax=Vigna umbellata TaxID=87088 RepID=UPI001F5F6643|nr:protein PHYTOCHROME KINASE SUBSTRATE 4-like [Vigna umbellata]